MTGLLLLGMAVVWLAVAAFIAVLVFRNLPKRPWRIPFALALFLLLIPLPLIDELVGERQFEQLCKVNSAIQIDRTKAARKTIYLADTPDSEVKGTWVRVVMQPRRFVDAATGEPVVSYYRLTAAGGLFVHAFRLSEGRVPLSFKGWCEPGDQHTLKNLFKELEITLIRRPAK
jgi:hypothetical protein